MSAPSSPIPTPASAPAWTHFFLGGGDTRSRPGKRGRRGRSAARPRSGDRSGTVLGEQWELLRRLGQGGMGEVYEAFYRGDRRRYAVKILSPGHADDPVTTERFRHEFLALRQMQAPGVVEAHALYRDGKDHFYSMELLGGRDLAALSREGPLPALEVIDLGLQLCATLAEVHAHGVIHRDVKPNNIVRLEDGSVKLVDLGVGKLLPAFYAETEARTPPEKRLLTAPGIKLGTPGYVAPEAGLGGAPCPRADVFSLGVTLFRLATRRMPFPAGRPVSIGDEPRSAEELGVELAPALETVLHRAMITDPRHRLPSMKEFAEELDDARAELLAVTPLESESVRGDSSGVVAKSGMSQKPAVDSPRSSRGRWRRAGGPLILGIGLVIGALVPFVVSLLATQADEETLGTVDLATSLRAHVQDRLPASPRGHDSRADLGTVLIQPETSPAGAGMRTMGEALDEAAVDLRRCAALAGGLMILRYTTEAKAERFAEVKILGPVDASVERCVQTAVREQRFRPEDPQVFLLDYEGDSNE